MKFFVKAGTELSELVLSADKEMSKIISCATSQLKNYKEVWLPPYYFPGNAETVIH